jgi:hypothetical protein
MGDSQVFSRSSLHSFSRTEAIPAPILGKHYAVSGRNARKKLTVCYIKWPVCANPRRNLGQLLKNAHRTGDPHQVTTLRAAGASWRVISERLGIGVGTACRALQSPSKNLQE